MSRETTFARDSLSIDLAVAAVSPLLIVGLVSSLALYLLNVFYGGEYQIRLSFVTLMFVLGAVGVSRISMIESASHAALFAAPLFGVTAIAAAVLAEPMFGAAGHLFNLLLLVLVWWASYKLTWDCTHVPRGGDTSNLGLLRLVGLERGREAAPPGAGAARAEPLSGDRDDEEEAEAADPHEFWLARAAARWLQPRPNRPGTWVVYFSLAAMPLFGLGQLFVAADDLPRRRLGLLLLAAYLACALALLATTSFLGLRRYLRLRGVAMPVVVTGVWLLTAAALTGGVLIAAWLPPRPRPEFSIAHWAARWKSPEQTPSSWGWGDEPARQEPTSEARTTEAPPAETPGADAPRDEPPPREPGDAGREPAPGEPNKADTTADSTGEPGDASSEPGASSKNPGTSENERATGEGASEKSSSEKQSPRSGKQETGEQARKSEPSRESDQASSGQQMEPARKDSPSQRVFDPQAWSRWGATGLAVLAQVAFYGFVLLLLVFLAWRYRRPLLAAWRAWVAAWRNWLRARAPPAPPPPPPAPPPPGFASFANPFASGMSGRASFAELVRYSYAALEAWARDRGRARPSAQTPREFAADLGQAYPHLGAEAAALAELYCDVTFGPDGARVSARTADTETLERFWSRA